MLGAQSCPPLCAPMDCTQPRFSVLGILQARILEWVAISYVTSNLHFEIFSLIIIFSIFFCFVLLSVSFSRDFCCQHVGSFLLM